MFVRPRLLPVLGLTLFAPLFAASATDTPATDPVEDAWTKSTLYLFNEAYQDFSQHDTAEARLGRAALLLLQQPKVDSNLVAAATQLEALTAESDASIAATARYLLARIAHIHRTPIDLPLATEHYRRLLSDHPGHMLADQALIKLFFIELYAPGLSDSERLAVIDRYAELANQLQRPASRRDLYLALGSACTNLRLDEPRALEYYLAADAAGVERPVLRANVSVIIGELALRLDRPEIARRYFERYLAEFQRDYRRTLVQDKLATLPALATTPSEARR